MKKACALLITIIILIMKSCGETSIRKEFFSNNDRKTANALFEEVIESIQNRDSDALKSLFADSVLEKRENLDEQIEELFDYYKGEMLSYNDHAGPQRNDEIQNVGEAYHLSTLYLSYDIETTQDKYRFSIKYIYIDTAHAENEGIISLCTIRTEDFADPSFTYHGNIETPGIHIQRK